MQTASYLLPTQSPKVAGAAGAAARTESTAAAVSYRAAARIAFVIETVRQATVVTVAAALVVAVPDLRPTDDAGAAMPAQHW